MSLKLNPQQQSVAQEYGNVFVQACPGSGKTRVLTQRIINEIQERLQTKGRVIALTYTNRAADEIKQRLDELYVPQDSLWTGTIHAFILEWILRPYACYSQRLKSGFSVVDEPYTTRIIEQLKQEYELNARTAICTRFTRTGGFVETDPQKLELLKEYHQQLIANKYIDYDTILYCGFKLITTFPEIARTLGSFIQLICVDEYQDTQDIQYAILSTIFRASGGFTKLFIVGDPDQAIYTSLGGIPKDAVAIKREFGLPDICLKELTGNYRSTQRIIDFCGNFFQKQTTITSLARYANERGTITFDNKTIAQSDLVHNLTRLINQHLANGVPENEICIIAPRWYLLTDLSRQLVLSLPTINFDAPGLSPFGGLRENIWYKITRLLLSQPAPRMFLVRTRWANEAINELQVLAERKLPESYSNSRGMLKLVNSLTSNSQDGLIYLEEAFEQLCTAIQLSIEQTYALQLAHEEFFVAAREKIDQSTNSIPSDTSSLKKLFAPTQGVLISSCHGIKGEEYETVICLGMLHGYIPHWSVCFDEQQDENLESRKMLYVISSRAKKHLHLIAEDGRFTQNQSPYQTNFHLEGITFDFDM